MSRIVAGEQADVELAGLLKEAQVELLDKAEDRVDTSTSGGAERIQSGDGRWRSRARCSRARITREVLAHFAGATAGRC
jgi:hypothetical protein